MPGEQSPQNGQVEHRADFRPRHFPTNPAEPIEENLEENLNKKGRVGKKGRFLGTVRCQRPGGRKGRALLGAFSLFWVCPSALFGPAETRAHILARW